MELHRIRLFLLLAMFAVGIVLYGEWQKEHPPKPLVSTEKNTTTELISSDLPETHATQSVVSSTSNTSASEWIKVKTDVLEVKIDPVGGRYCLCRAFSVSRNITLQRRRDFS